MPYNANTLEIIHSGDFRDAMRVALSSRVIFGDGLLDEATDKVISICEKMLLPEKHPEQIGVGGK